MNDDLVPAGLQVCSVQEWLDENVQSPEMQQEDCELLANRRDVFGQALSMALWFTAPLHK